MKPITQRLLGAFALALCLQPQAFAAETDPAQVNLDYAYYSPVSLVLKHFGWLEQALPNSKVGWVLSQGSNRSLEYLNSGGVDFASSASLSAVLSRANGSPIKSVYVYSRAEWTALVVRKDSPFKSVTDLKGVIKEILLGEVVSEIDVQTASGIVTSVITTRSVRDLELKVGSEVIAFVKSTEVSIAKL